MLKTGMVRKMTATKACWLLAFVIWGSPLRSAPVAWTSNGPPETVGGVWSLAVATSQPTTVYAGTRDGVWKSLDAGGSWSPAGLEGFTILSLAVDPADPDTVYAMAEESSYFEYGTVSKTTDGGSSWSNLVYLGKFESMTSISVDPSEPSVVYTRSLSHNTGGYHLAKSTDGFVSFTNVDPGAPGSVASFALDPRNPSVLYLLYGPGEFESDDKGETWSEIGAGPGIGRESFLIADPFTPGTLFGAGDSGVSRSEDGGRSWAPTPFVGKVTAVVADPVHAGTIFAGTENGVFVSPDRGETWVDISSTLPEGTLVTSLAKGTGTLHAGSYFAGVFEWTPPIRSVPVMPGPRTSPAVVHRRP
jgi:hypothetical protein